MINYNQYPSLLFLSYNKDNAPEHLPFEVSSPDVLTYLSDCAGYQEMFGIIASLNTLGLNPKHFWLNNRVFNDVEYDMNFRNSKFRNFLLSPPEQIQYGCICFKDGGQYVYLYLPKDKAKIKGLDKAYLCTALFKENLFIGFEETLVDRGFSVMPTGHYSGGMDIGGYLSFVSICLSFFSKDAKVVGAAINQTSETIYTK